MLAEVASGMDFLASQRVVHKQLMAKNCLVDENFHIKVSNYFRAQDSKCTFPERKKERKRKKKKKKRKEKKRKETKKEQEDQEEKEEGGEENGTISPPMIVQNGRLTVASISILFLPCLLLLLHDNADKKETWRETIYDLPIRWMAPECILTTTFNTRSDMYSYAMVMWEVISDGVMP
mgnify:CR=1 FL=1